MYEADLRKQKERPFASPFASLLPPLLPNFIKILLFINLLLINH
jgi:hypothetical protein